jgi:hypothetical protein
MRDVSTGILLSKRALTFFTILLLGSLGLCGANYAGFAVFRFHPQAGGILMFTGMLELIGMIVGATGLVVSAFALMVLSLIDRLRDDNESITIFRSDDK